MEIRKLLVSGAIAISSITFFGSAAQAMPAPGGDVGPDCMLCDDDDVKLLPAAEETVIEDDAGSDESVPVDNPADDDDSVDDGRTTDDEPGPIRRYISNLREGWNRYWGSSDLGTGTN